MFDFGFWEIILILMVALIVVGPERLPGLARTAGLWIGKAKRFVTDVKAEIDQELAADELKKALNKQEAMSDVYEIIEETRKATSDFKQEINKTAAESTSAVEHKKPEEQADQEQPDQESTTDQKANQTLP
jgi:sec-independent protein translocase protein TatB